MSKESNIDKILRGETRGYESWYVKYVMENATSLLKSQKEKQGFGKPGQRTNEQIEAEIEHLRAKDTETNNRVRSTYNLSK
jgi:hypothetical protein